MTLLTFLAALAPFVFTTLPDPIDGTRVLAFAAADEDNMLLLACQEGTDSLMIRFVPERYYGKPANLLFQGPKVVSRFSQASEPTSVGWFFDDTAIEFVGAAVKGNEQKAAFIDQLARDTSFSIRYAVDEKRTETATISYTIDTAELGRFLGRCNPKRVNQYLKDWGSPAAPRQP